jgi:bifunctional non-homologous end joining protein LigD
VLSRNGLDWTGRLHSVAAACGKLKAKSFTIDGESVVLDAKGASSFARMQDAMARTDDSRADAPYRARPQHELAEIQMPHIDGSRS